MTQRSAKIIRFVPGRLRRREGLSLVELTITIGIIGLGLPAIAYMFGVMTQQDNDSAMGVQAHYLANGLMNEISKRRFRESSAIPAGGPQSSEIDGYSRRNFDDISDYSYFESTWGKLTPPRDEDGNVLPNLSQFSQYVTVRNVPGPTVATNARSIASVADGTTDFKQVTVTIYWQNGKKSVSLSKIFALTP